jgi:hypothetical protein
MVNGTVNGRLVVVRYLDRRPPSRRAQSGVVYRLQVIGKRNRPQNVTGWEGARFASYTTCRHAIAFVQHVGGSYDDWVNYRRKQKSVGAHNEMHLSQI